MVPPRRRTKARTCARPMPCPGLSWVPRTAKQLENTLMVLWIDAAPIVRYLENRKAELGAATHCNLAGNSSLEVFERIVDQIGKDLFQGKAIAHDIRQGVDLDLGLGLRRLMRYGRDDALHQLPGVDQDRLERAAAFAGEGQDRRYQPVHLADRRLNEPECLGEIFRQLLVGAFKRGLGRVSCIFRNQWRGRLLARQRSNSPEDVAAQLLQFAGEAHDVDQRRTQVVADDVGETLDLVIGFAQVRGTLVDRGLEIEVVVPQLGFGFVPRPAQIAAPGKSRSRPGRSPGWSPRS